MDQEEGIALGPVQILPEYSQGVPKSNILLPTAKAYTGSVARGAISEAQLRVVALGDPTELSLDDEEFKLIETELRLKLQR